MEVLFFIFACISILAAVSLHISFSIGSNKQFDKVARAFLMLVIIQVLCAFLVNLAPFEYQYIDRAEPLALLYGPLLYFGHVTSSERDLNKRKILFHILPFLVAIPFYILFLTIESFRNHEFIYYFILYGLIAVSWLFYASWVAFHSTYRKGQNIYTNKELSSILVLILFALSFYFILLVLTKTLKGSHAESIAGNLMIYGATLGAVLSVYLFMIRRLKEKIDSLTTELKKLDDIGEEVSMSYLKSGVQTDDIDEYARKVNDFLSSKKYLDPRFNLKRMSSELKIPKHHLSQVFNQYYGQNFLKYINSLRIMHACKLLEDLDLDSNIEDLAEKCGFNSKATFYRNFREIAKMTPSEFLSRSEKKEVT